MGVPPSDWSTGFDGQDGQPEIAEGGYREREGVTSSISFFPLPPCSRCSRSVPGALGTLAPSIHAAFNPCSRCSLCLLRCLSGTCCLCWLKAEPSSKKSRARCPARPAPAAPQHVATGHPISLKAWLHATLSGITSPPLRSMSR
jgi:hypothetical protein